MTKEIDLEVLLTKVAMSYFIVFEVAFENINVITFCENSLSYLRQKIA
jgi:hypothetical protein